MADSPIDSARLALACLDLTSLNDNDDAQAIVLFRHRLQSFDAGIGAAVHDHPDRGPLRERRAHGFKNPGTGVVAGNQN